jgi:hypothetical protein
MSQLQILNERYQPDFIAGAILGYHGTSAFYSSDMWYKAGGAALGWVVYPIIQAEIRGGNKDVATPKQAALPVALSVIIANKLYGQDYTKLALAGLAGYVLSASWIPSVMGMHQVNVL